MSSSIHRSLVSQSYSHTPGDILGDGYLAMHPVLCLPELKLWIFICQDFLLSFFFHLLCTTRTNNSDTAYIDSNETLPKCYLV